MLRTLAATRYAVPLREGGSLPAVVAASNGTEEELFVVKFKGAGQGARALLAELIVGPMADMLGLPIPETVLIELDAGFGRTERDPEIQDILKASVGLNAGLGYLDGAFNFNPLAHGAMITEELAADIVWLDAFTTNIDRTARNPNLMIHDRKPWLIDHGAALYFHHNWATMTAEKAQLAFPPIRDHVLLLAAGDLAEADVRMRARFRSDELHLILRQLPDDLLMHAPTGTRPDFADADTNREAYLQFFLTRLEGKPEFVTTAIEAQERLRAERPKTLHYRR